jgi:FtsZ-binding cell division protein ZapB
MEDEFTYPRSAIDKRNAEVAALKAENARLVSDVQDLMGKMAAKNTENAKLRMALEKVEDAIASLQLGDKV